MSYYGYFEYVPVAEKKERNKKAVEKLRKKNPGIAPIIISGRKLTASWWGKAWNDNLESYSDYENRMERGRSYIRHGAVLDLQIAPGRVTALVQGSERKPYVIGINIKPLEKAVWDEIVRTCEGKIESLQEMLEGRFPKALKELFTAKGNGLFPAPKEISFSCSCPDYASMCKHVAAALYGVAARLDENPALFFSLRGVGIDELISKALVQKSEKLLARSGRAGRRVIENDDISGMFGIELDDTKPVFTDSAKEETGIIKKSAGKRGRKPKKGDSICTDDGF